MPIRSSVPGRRRSRPTACRATAGGRSTTTRSSTSSRARLIAGNPTLAAALANYAQARALADQARAGLFPTLGLERRHRTRPRIDQRAAEGPTTPRLLRRQHGRRQRQLRARPVGANSQRGRRGKANAAAAAADLEYARLSLIAQLVDDYIQLRSLDRDIAILDETVDAYARALELTEQRHDAGIAPGLDVSQARDPARCRTLAGGADSRPARADGTRDCGAARRVGLDFLDQAADRRYRPSADPERRSRHLAAASSGYRRPHSGA